MTLAAVGQGVGIRLELRRKEATGPRWAVGRKRHWLGCVAVLGRKRHHGLQTNLKPSSILWEAGMTKGGVQ